MLTVRPHTKSGGGGGGGAVHFRSDIRKVGGGGGGGGQFASGPIRKVGGEGGQFTGAIRWGNSLLVRYEKGGGGGGGPIPLFGTKKILYR